MSRALMVIRDKDRPLPQMEGLLALGVEVACAEGAVEALAAARRLSPDFILCQRDLAGAEFETFLRVLKSDPRLRRLRIVAIESEPASGLGAAAISHQAGVPAVSWDAPAEVAVAAALEGEPVGEAPTPQSREPVLHIAALDALSASIAIVDVDGTLLYVNRTWRRFAYENDAAMRSVCEGANYFDVCEQAIGEDAGIALDFVYGMRGVIAGRLTRFQMEYPCHGPDVLRWFVGQVTRTQPEGECPVVVSHEDVTVRRMAEMALRESEARSRAFLKQASDPIFIHDEQGRLIEVNDQACQSLGYTREQLLDMRVMDIEVDFDLQRAIALWDSVQPGQTLNVLGHHRHRSGALIPVEVRVGCFVLEEQRYFLGIARDMSERLRSEMALLNRDRHLRMAVGAGNVGLWDWDLVANEIWYSPEWKRQIGHGEEEIGSSPEEWRKRVHPDDLDNALRAIQDCIEGRTSLYQSEFRFRHRDGSYRWILARGSLLLDAFRRPSRLLGANLDISERRLAEEALRQSEERYRRLFDSNPQPMWVYDLKTLRFMAVNPAAVAHYGYSVDEFLAMTLLDIRPPAEAQRLLDRISSTPDGFDNAGVWTHRKKDGALIEVEVRVHTMMLGNRRTGLVLANDITARRQAEQRVKQLNRIHTVLSEINKLIVRERELGGMLNGACRVAVERGGFLLAWIGAVDPVAQMIRPVARAGNGESYVERLGIDLKDPARLTGPVGRALLSRKHALSNDILQDPGFVPWRELAAEFGLRSAAAFPLLHSEREQPMGILCLYASEPGFFDADEVQLLDELASDIAFALEACSREDERKHTYEAMQESEQRFRQLAESIEDVFWMTNASRSRLLYVSPAYERIWGRPLASLYEHPPSWMDAIHEDDRERISNAIAADKDGGSYDAEYRIRRPGGEVRWIRDRAFPVTGPDGRLVRIVGVARDVTERRELEEQLRQSQKLEAIGLLAGGIAHDFNNILGAILMQAELAQMDTDLKQDLREGLEEIRLSAQRAASLTRQLLFFSRRQVMQLKVVDLNDVVAGLSKMLQRIIGEDIRLQLHLEPYPLMTKADSGMLDQVLLNLAINSRDAMPAGGRLLLETDRYHVTEEIARRHPDAQPGTYVRLSVSDSGGGIAPEILPRIFEPFFTTKGPGKGTGLGLSTVFGIVRQHRGWIRVESVKGRGTRFEVLLPASTEQADAVQPTGGRPATSGKGQVVLLAEDDFAVRVSARAVLERHDYHVLEATNGVEALEIWQRMAGMIRVLVTDLVMPGGMDGYALARRLKTERSSLGVVFMSGYSAEIAGRNLELEPGEQFLQKPFSPDKLLEAVGISLGSG